jgi:hypothetical protein
VTPQSKPSADDEETDLLARLVTKTRMQAARRRAIAIFEEGQSKLKADAGTNVTWLLGVAALHLTACGQLIAALGEVPTDHRGRGWALASANALLSALFAWIELRICRGIYGLEEGYGQLEKNKEIVEAGKIPPVVPGRLPSHWRQLLFGGWMSIVVVIMGALLIGAGFVVAAF